jgi:hypothetical protein
MGLTKNYVNVCNADLFGSLYRNKDGYENFKLANSDKVLNLIDVFTSELDFI